MTRRTNALTQEGHNIIMRAAVRAGLKHGASRKSMSAALHAAEVTLKRYAKPVDEPLLALAGGNWEHVSNYQIASLQADLDAEMLRRRLLADGATS